MKDIFHKGRANLTEEDQLKIKMIKERAESFLECITHYCPHTREKLLSTAKLEECVMWATKSITVKYYE
jgi:hypothetical protein